MILGKLRSLGMPWPTMYRLVRFPPCLCRNKTVLPEVIDLGPRNDRSNVGTTQEQAGQWKKTTPKKSGMIKLIDHNENEVATESSGTSWVWKRQPSLAKRLARTWKTSSLEQINIIRGSLATNLIILLCGFSGFSAKSGMLLKVHKRNPYQRTRLKSYHVSVHSVFRIDSDASSFGWLLVWILFHACKGVFCWKVLLNLLYPICSFCMVMPVP